jgi:hypothetical protein
MPKRDNRYIASPAISRNPQRHRVHMILKANPNGLTPREIAREGGWDYPNNFNKRAPRIYRKLYEEGKVKRIPYNNTYRWFAVRGV